ncbi:MAG: BrnT family toxin [Devosia sp.]|jgi:uncharacterized DUF497 family protein|uniref:BrnT family toxin n=1 Tax=Devosia sp. 66-22 TaxID=1895753 RepID=UPI000926FB18|nr:BrnT family toxin [Devosia sp. 66-22]MBN9344605.1 BrnT family toxin [Devosia sp.]OJX53165.1 MAG: hypothetical protein BGO81_02450 [Devosia sp. 66-22]
MRIVWDEPKRLANIDKHEVDLADVTEEFLNNARLFPAKLGRVAAVGMHRGHLMTAIVEPLGNEATAVISFRIASRKERRDYWH